MSWPTPSKSSSKFNRPNRATHSAHSATIADRDKLLQSQEETFNRRLIHEMTEFNRRIESEMAASTLQLSEEALLRVRYAAPEPSRPPPPPIRSIRAADCARSKLRRRRAAAAGAALPAVLPPSHPRPAPQGVEGGVRRGGADREGALRC